VIEVTIDRHRCKSIQTEEASGSFSLDATHFGTLVTSDNPPGRFGQWLRFRQSRQLGLRASRKTTTPTRP